MDQLQETLWTICDRVAVCKETDLAQANKLASKLLELTNTWEVDPMKQENELADKTLMKNIFPFYWLLVNQSNNDH